MTDPAALLPVFPRVLTGTATALRSGKERFMPGDVRLDPGKPEGNTITKTAATMTTAARQAAIRRTGFFCGRREKNGLFFHLSLGGDAVTGALFPVPGSFVYARDCSFRGRPVSRVETAGFTTCS